MWAVAFVVVVLVVVAVAVALVRRPRGGDVHSVANYNHALGTLEHLSERIGPPTVRPVRVVPSGQSGTTERLVPPVPVRGTDEFPDPDAPIVFDDARPVERGRPGGTEPTTPARTDRAQRIALDSMNHRSRPGTGVMVAIAIVVVFGALAIVGSQTSHNSSHTTPTTTTRPAGSGATPSTAPKPTPTTKPTPTALPSQFVATTTSSDGTAATYTLPHATYQITITGTGSCWVQVDSAATGATVWAGELSAGTVQNVPASGSTTVQFGTPTLTLQVDGVPVVLPTPLRTPFVATFTPSATATPGATPAASSTSSSTSSTATTAP
ncbi:MAG TPA: DUF4115 domain-containing protein [Acidimicrobiales bacterium]